VLDAYVDASGKGDKERLVIAGYIAPPEAWGEFSAKWQEALSLGRMKYFKMNEMAGKPEIAGYFYRIIEESGVKASISCVVNTYELTRIFDSIAWPPYITHLEGLSNPYYFAFKAVIDVLAQYNEALGLNEAVNFIFDNEAEKANTLKYWPLIKENSAPGPRTLMGEPPIYRDDKTTLPLQAADLFAWWVLKWEREGIKNWGEDLPFPWEAKRNIRRLTMSFSERDFRTEYSAGLVKVARSEAELSYAQSILRV
jgi:Protein of unknown function (DUF3800)